MTATREDVYEAIRRIFPTVERCQPLMVLPPDCQMAWCPGS